MKWHLFDVTCYTMCYYLMKYCIQMSYICGFCSVKLLGNWLIMEWSVFLFQWSSLPKKSIFKNFFHVIKIEVMIVLMLFSLPREFVEHLSCFNIKTKVVMAWNCYDNSSVFWFLNANCILNVFLKTAENQFSLHWFQQLPCSFISF